MPGDLARRWRDLAVFPAPFDRSGGGSGVGGGAGRRAGSLDALCQQSLVECDGSAYSLHDLLREIALEEPPADEVYLPACRPLPGLWAARRTTSTRRAR